ncbi:hypothetical protein BKA60DRAFT_659100 [Fusarium oxysporum]|nr:hypothetical protein BKA60DRAFT_659100 [Fusarium oxysporum]
MDISARTCLKPLREGLVPPQQVIVSVIGQGAAVHLVDNIQRRQYTRISNLAISSLRRQVYRRYTSSSRAMAKLSKPVCMICAVQLWGWSPGYTAKDKQPAESNPWPCGEARPKSLKISDEDVVVHNKRAYNRGQVTLSNGREVSLKFENLPERRYRDQDAANGSHWYLGVHCACLDVAERLMNESSGKARSIGELWMTIERRRVKTADDENIRPLYLPSIPKNRVPRLTESLMSNLERADTPTTHEKFTNNFNNLPREIRDIIVALLHDGSMSLECTYLISQSHWKDTFLRIHFVWDIEKDLVQAKDQEATSGPFEWNWEKLARQILAEISPPETDDEIGPVGEDCQDEIEIAWSYQKFRLNVPPGLTNRRRVWQILINVSQRRRNGASHGQHG